MMKYVFLTLLGALMLGGAITFSIFGPDLSDGEQFSLFVFGGIGVYALIEGIEGMT